MQFQAREILNERAVWALTEVLFLQPGCSAGSISEVLHPGPDRTMHSDMPLPMAGISACHQVILVLCQHLGDSSGGNRSSSLCHSCDQQGTGRGKQVPVAKTRNEFWLLAADAMASIRLFLFL